MTWGELKRIIENEMLSEGIGYNSDAEIVCKSGRYILYVHDVAAVFDQGGPGTRALDEGPGQYQLTVTEIKTPVATPIN